MDWFYSFFIAFSLVFFSELGDKTQLLVLSFSNKSKTFPILFGVAIGTFFSHGLAILFGSKIGGISSSSQFYLSILTYVSFVIFGVYGFWKSYRDPFDCCSCCDNFTVSNEHLDKSSGLDRKSNLISKICGFKLNYVFIVAMCIIIGELGDKTFLASLGLGVQYPCFKFSLICGSILGMVASNSIAIFFGRLIKHRFSEKNVENFSNFLFVLFGIIGILLLFIPNCDKIY